MTSFLPSLLVVVGTALTVALVCLFHYEGLVWLSGGLAKRGAQQRRKVLFGIFVVLVLHIAEIWMFGGTLWLLLRVPGTGHILGLEDAGLLDAVYLSAATFSTVGFGDVAPAGPIRFLSGTEALVGFVMITWSASFMYLEMDRYWRKH